MYLLCLDENFADKEKYQWHTTQKKLLNKLKQEKQLIGTRQLEIVHGILGRNLLHGPTLSLLSAFMNLKISFLLISSINRASMSCLVEHFVLIWKYFMPNCQSQYRALSDIDFFFQLSFSFSSRLVRSKVDWSRSDLLPTRIDASCVNASSYSFAPCKEGRLYLVVKVADFLFNRVQGFLLIQRKQEDYSVYHLHPSLIFKAPQ